MSLEPQLSEHDRVKHAVATSLREYVSNLPSEHAGSVETEKRILDGDRRVDVTLHREFAFRSSAWAFEIKTTLGDALSVTPQLRDYKKAGFTPVFIKKDNLVSGADEPDSIVNNAQPTAAVAEASVNGESVVFNPLSGFKRDTCLSGLAIYWDGREFSLNARRDQQDAVLDVFREYSMANPYLIREETGLEKGDVNTALVRLSRNGWVEQVTRGLYRFVGDERESDAAALSPDAVADARRELDGLETALERGDRAAIEGRLESLREVLDDAE